ncbi:MAG: MFS transporter [Acidimicrobiaceae bacterium]|nr:MFS transporter [Acidimicrobiaceae bacterium]
MIVTMGGMGVGQLMLNLADPGGFKLFVVSSALISFALVPVALSASTAPPLVVPEPISLRELVKVVPLGLLTAFWVGVSQGCLMGLGAFYAASEGLSNTRISLFVVSSMVGSVAFQWLVGSSSDRVPRRYVILVVAIIAAGSAGLHLLVSVGSALSLLLMFVHGGSTFPLYSLAVATTADSVSPAQLTGASASLVRVSGIGAVIGPTLGGLLMAAVAPWAYFGVLIVCHAVIALYVLYRMFTRPAPPVAEQGTFDPWPLRASAVAANLLRRPRLR